MRILNREFEYELRTKKFLDRRKTDIYNKIVNDFKNFEELKNKFNWGAFFLTWIWGLVNNTYITLIALPISFIPKLGGLLNLLLAIYFGIKGNEWALKNKKFKSELYFLKFQKIIAIIGLIVTATLLTLMIILDETTKLYPSTANLELIRQQTMLLVFILCTLLFTIYIIGLVFIIKISIKKEETNQLGETKQ